MKHFIFTIFILTGFLLTTHVVKADYYETQYNYVGDFSDGSLTWSWNNTNSIQRIGQTFLGSECLNSPCMVDRFEIDMQIFQDNYGGLTTSADYYINIYEYSGIDTSPASGTPIFSDSITTNYPDPGSETWYGTTMTFDTTETEIDSNLEYYWEIYSPYFSSNGYNTKTPIADYNSNGISIVMTSGSGWYQYGTGDFVGWSLQDNQGEDYSVVEILDLSDTYDVSIMRELDVEPYQMYCSIDPSDICQYDLRYDYRSDGWTAYLFKSELDYTDLGNHIASSTLYANPYNISTIQVPNETTEQFQKYTIVFYDDLDDVQAVFSQMPVWWVATSSNETLCQRAGVAEYDIETACADVATSTGSYASDFRYGMECGFNKSMYWLFKPSCDTIFDVQNSADNLLNEFPLNIFRQVIGAFSNATSSEDMALELYVGELTNSSSSKITMLDSDFMDNVWGETWSKIYTLMEYIIYMVTTLYFIRFFITRTRDEENLP